MSTPRDPIYAGYRHPAELISYAVWLYFRFPLSLRMVEEMLAARGQHLGHRRDDSAMGAEVRPRVRQPHPPASAAPGRQVALGRCVTNTSPQ
jgi:putative transposase